MFSENEVIERMRFTPAEKALIQEQSEAMRLSLNLFIAFLKAGPPFREALKSWAEFGSSFVYIENLIQTEVDETVRALAFERKFGE